MAANIIPAKCSKHNKPFGVRVEKRENDWVRTWAFPINEAKAKREGFRKTQITGSLEATPDYPGCPYCGAKEFIICLGCGKMSCWNEERKSAYCYHCNTQIGEIEISQNFNVKSGGY